MNNLVIRLEEWNAGACGHLHRLLDPGELLRPLHLRHNVHGRMEERLRRHAAASLHHSGADYILLRLQVRRELNMQRMKTLVVNSVVYVLFFTK